MTGQQTALIAGTGGAIGRALREKLRETHQVLSLSSRDQSAEFLSDYSEASLSKITQSFDSEIHLLVICNGLLHNHALQPEKRLDKLTAAGLHEYFHANTVVPALVLKTFLPFLSRKAAVRIAVLTARVGSIEENALGGWYGYRAAKAASNQLVKTFSIELARLNGHAAIVALHPGTTRSSLSEPFMPKEGRADISKLPWMSPSQTADSVVGVINSLTPEDNGRFLDWQGKEIRW